jgi:hypothetical protein
MSTDNKTIEEKKKGQLAGCVSVIYGVVAIAVVIYSIYVLVNI